MYVFINYISMYISCLVTITQAMLSLGSDGRVCCPKNLFYWGFIYLLGFSKTTYSQILVVIALPIVALNKSRAF